MRNFALLVTVATCLLVLACSNKSESTDSEELIANQSAGTIAGQDDVNNSESTYQPPADGRLTDTQIDMYIAVRKHEGEMLASSAKNVAEKSQKAKESSNGISSSINSFEAMQAAMDFANLDFKAAKDLKYNPDEYEWVKQTILDTNIAIENANQAAALQTDFLMNLEKSKQEMEQSIKDAPNEETRRALLDARESLDKGKEQLSRQMKLSEDIKHNQRLIEKHQTELSVLNDEIRKWSHLDKLH